MAAKNNMILNYSIVAVEVCFERTLPQQEQQVHLGDFAALQK
jgi:hypothetical protein